jgi:hypothetical protein
MVSDYRGQVYVVAVECMLAILFLGSDRRDWLQKKTLAYVCGKRSIFTACPAKISVDWVHGKKHKISQQNQIP